MSDGADHDEETLADRTQPVTPDHADVLADDSHDDATAAEAAEQADPSVTAADHGA